MNQRLIELQCNVAIYGKMHQGTLNKNLMKEATFEYIFLESQQWLCRDFFMLLMEALNSQEFLLSGMPTRRILKHNTQAPDCD